MQGSRGNIPQTDRTVIPTSSTGEGAAIRAERKARNIVRMPGEGVACLARGNIPQPDGVVPTPTGEGGAIRTERNVQDPARVSGEGMLHRPRGDIPQTDGAIPTPTGEGAAIRTERNAIDSRGMV